MVRLDQRERRLVELRRDAHGPCVPPVARMRHQSVRELLTALVEIFVAPGRVVELARVMPGVDGTARSRDADVTALHVVAVLRVVHDREPRAAVGHVDPRLRRLLVAVRRALEVPVRHLEGGTVGLDGRRHAQLEHAQLLPPVEDGANLDERRRGSEHHVLGQRRVAEPALDPDRRPHRPVLDESHRCALERAGDVVVPEHAVPPGVRVVVEDDGVRAPAGEVGAGPLVEEPREPPGRGVDLDCQVLVLEPGVGRLRRGALLGPGIELVDAVPERRQVGGEHEPPARAAHRRLRADRLHWDWRAGLVGHPRTVGRQPRVLELDVAAKRPRVRVEDDDRPQLGLGRECQSAG